MCSFQKPETPVDSSESPLDSDDATPMRARKPGRPPKSSKGSKSPKPRGRPGRPRKTDAERARRKYIRIRQNNPVGRPRTAAAAALRDDVRAGIELLHDLTLQTNAVQPEPAVDALRVCNLPKALPDGYESEIPSSCKYPGLDALMG
jgi:hypothetical protein